MTPQTSPRQSPQPSTGVSPQILGGCVEATYSDGKICANIPLIGQHCLSFPSLPSGSGSAKVCAEYKFPASAEVCAFINNYKIGCITL